MNQIFYEAQLNNKKILFITTKNLDYIRNTQEIALLQESCGEEGQLSIIGSRAKSYGKRLLQVYWSLFVTTLSDYDVVFVGFAPQLVLCLPFLGGKIPQRPRHNLTMLSQKETNKPVASVFHSSLPWSR